MSTSSNLNHVPLTRREKEVAQLAVLGWTSREIGRELFIGYRTVETHLENIYKKVGVHSRDELLRWAMDTHFGLKGIEMATKRMQVQISNQPVNYRDLLFKIFWTMVTVGLAMLGTVLVDVDAWYALPASGVINYILGWIRQFIGVTPPSLPSTKELNA